MTAMGFNLPKADLNIFKLSQWNGSRSSVCSTCFMIYKNTARCSGDPGLNSILVVLLHVLGHFSTSKTHSENSTI